MRQTIALLATVLTLGYLLPWSCAYWSRRKDTVAIGLLNLLLGWTFVGWVIALVWANKED